MDWTATTGATGYTVQWSTSSTFDGTPSSAPASSNTHKITSGLTSGTYHFRVIANKSGYDDSVPSDSVSATTGKTDYDNDNDGLIGVDNLAKLNAMRYDLDGDGQVDDPANQSAYDLAFTNAEDNMGCGESVGTISSQNTGNPACKGYELTKSLNFDTDRDKDVDSDDNYPNWTPIGDSTTAYTGEFHGNGFTVSNLTINVSSAGHKRMGLFGKLGSGAKVENVQLKDVSIAVVSTSGTPARVGALAGENAGSVTGSWSSGSVSAETQGRVRHLHPDGRLDRLQRHRRRDNRQPLHRVRHRRGGVPSPSRRPRRTQQGFHNRQLRRRRREPWTASPSATPKTS